MSQVASICQLVSVLCVCDANLRKEEEKSSGSLGSTTLLSELDRRKKKELFVLHIGKRERTLKTIESVD